MTKSRRKSVQYNEQERMLLSQNPNVSHVNETAITYSPAFKVAAVHAYKTGKTPAQIFIDAGFNLDIIGHDKPKQCLNRWRISFSRYGEDGLLEERRGKGSSGGPSSKELTVEEKLRRAEARIQLLQAENDLLKKLETLERNRNKGLTTSERFRLAYDVIRKHRLQRLTRYVCKILEVSTSGYYRFIQAEKHRQQTKEHEMIDYELIKQHFDRSGGKAGALTIKMKLERHHGVVMNHKKIRRIMRAYHLVAAVRQANPYRKLARATQEHLTCPNHLNRQFNQHEPEKVMLTDITYLHYGNGQCAYLSCVKDGATREILAYHVSSSISMNLVSETLNRLFERFQGDIHPEAIFHSNQGFHYTHPSTQKTLRERGITQSMSRRGNCLDNAPMESFFGHMKDEMSYANCQTIEEVRQRVSEYMAYYNSERPQWTLKKMTPSEFRSHLIAC